MRIDFLSKKAYEEINKVRENYKEEINNALEEKGLNGMVVRTKDGAVGKLLIAYDFLNTLNYEVRFYPVTKSGAISKKASGYVTVYVDIEEQFAPYKGAETPAEKATIC